MVFFHREPRMAWLRIALTDEQQVAVAYERDHGGDVLVRTKMLVLWSLHCGLERETAAKVAGVGRVTVQRYVRAFRDGGLEQLRRREEGARRVSEMADHAESIKASLTQRPVPTVAQACDRIEQLTGIRRGPTQVRKFLAKHGFKYQRTRAVPLPPKKT